MPIRAQTAAGQFRLLEPTEQWQTITVPGLDPAEFHVDVNYYVVPKPLPQAPPQPANW